MDDKSSAYTSSEPGYGMVTGTVSEKEGQGVHIGSNFDICSGAVRVVDIHLTHFSGNRPSSQNVVPHFIISGKDWSTALVTTFKRDLS